MPDDSNTVLVPLTQGKVAIIDAKDAPLVLARRWQVVRIGKQWYARSNREYLHRLLMSPPTGMTVDHINGDGLDNRRANLRIASHAQNHWNTGKQANNTSGYLGVTWSRQHRKWKAQIWAEGKMKCLGEFSCPIEAARARDAAAIRYRGEFAHLNFPDDQ